LLSFLQRIVDEGQVYCQRGDVNYPSQAGKFAIALKNRWVVQGIESKRSMRGLGRGLLLHALRLTPLGEERLSLLGGRAPNTGREVASLKDFLQRIAASLKSGKAFTAELSDPNFQSDLSNYWLASEKRWILSQAEPTTSGERRTPFVAFTVDELTPLGREELKRLEASV